MKCYVLTKHRCEEINYEYVLFKDIVKISFDRWKLLRFVEQMAQEMQKCSDFVLTIKYKNQSTIIEGGKKNYPARFIYEITGYDIE